MPRSKFPSELDSSIELPAVRDNITEISSDTINSLRSAIFQIEKTLGINPQGASGSSVASRLGNALDANGNILKDALDRSNVLSGPVSDVDVSSVAAIKESKLNLNFPTQLLQDEISQLNGQLDNILLQLTELAAQFAAHTNPSSLNRHLGTAISLEEASVLASDVATVSLEDGSSQETWETLYNAHINYTGANISQINNAHRADQLYFDNDEVDDVIFNKDVQSAIEDLANIESVGIRNSILNLNSNGRIRSGSVIDGYEGRSSGSLLLGTSSVTYIQAAGDSRTNFSLASPATLLGDISRFDILTLSGSSTSNDNTDYQISDYVLDGSGKLTSVEVFGGPKGDSVFTIESEIKHNSNFFKFSQPSHEGLIGGQGLGTFAAAYYLDGKHMGTISYEVTE